MAAGKPLLVLNVNGILCNVNGILCRRVRCRDDDEAVAYPSSLGHVVALTDSSHRYCTMDRLKPILLLLDYHVTLAVWSSAPQSKRHLKS
jgi:hypothetical protein